MITELAKNQLLEGLKSVADRDHADKLAQAVLEGKLQMKEVARRLGERA